MGSLRDGANSAVLVIDVQNDVVAHAHDRDTIVGNIDQVVASARTAGALVVWIQHHHDELRPDTAGWQIVPELVPVDGEPIVHKKFRDSFESTTLEAELAQRQISRLIVTGSQTDYCVRWTLHGAHARGYDTVLVADGHTTDAESPDGMPGGAELIAHTNAIWASQTAPSVRAAVCVAADLEF